MRVGLWNFVIPVTMSINSLWLVSNPVPFRIPSLGLLWNQAWEGYECLVRDYCLISNLLSRLAQLVANVDLLRREPRRKLMIVPRPFSSTLFRMRVTTVALNEAIQLSWTVAPQPRWFHLKSMFLSDYWAASQIVVGYLAQIDLTIRLLVS